MWFKYKDTTIKWQYPVGVLFDLLGNPEELPWPLTVYFQGFPSTVLMRLADQQNGLLKSQFMSSVKESSVLKFGENKVINLSTEDRNNLWDSLLSNDYEKFWEVNNKLYPDRNQLKSLAVRIIRASKDRPIIQEPISDPSMTLGDLLANLLPSLFGSGGEVGKELKAVAIVQGISPPLNTPIGWLAEHCSHPDNFLYIVVREKSGAGVGTSFSAAK